MYISGWIFMRLSYFVAKSTKLCILGQHWDCNCCLKLGHTSVECNIWILATFAMKVIHEGTSHQWENCFLKDVLIYALLPFHELLNHPYSSVKPVKIKARVWSVSQSFTDTIYNILKQLSTVHQLNANDKLLWTLRLLHVEFYRLYDARCYEIFLKKLYINTEYSQNSPNFPINYWGNYQVVQFDKHVPSIAIYAPKMPLSLQRKLTETASISQQRGRMGSIGSS